MYKSRQQQNSQDDLIKQQQQDFPIICEKCLGDSPYMTMTRSENNKECKICARPFTVYRWKPDNSSRWKKTEICKTCSQVKNVCQVCIHDLEFGLPVQVRDAVLSTQFESAPVTEKGTEYMATQNQRMIDNGEISYENFQPTDIIQKVQRSVPYKQNPNISNNQNRICSFYLKGNCNRGDQCPYKHDGGNNNNNNEQPPKKPSDQSITTLFLGNIDFDKVKEDDLRNNLFVYGTITKVKTIPHQKCAFITFDTRQSAENAIDSLFNNFKIDDCNIKLNWSKSNKPPVKQQQPQQQNNKPKQQNQQQQQPQQQVLSSLVSSYADDDDDDNNDNNDSNNSKNNETENKDESNPTPPKKEEKPAFKPLSFTSFNVNSAPNSNNNNNNTDKPYYSSMDPNNYGSKYK